MVKKCFFCGSSNVVHNGLRGHIQRYKCKDCGRRFDGGRRRNKAEIITDYIEGKQTRAQLALKYGVSVRTIARDLEGMRYVQKISRHKHVIIQMDTTYWGRGFGLMIIKDALRKKIIWRKYVKHETVASYMEGVQWLEEHGFKKKKPPYMRPRLRSAYLSIKRNMPLLWTFYDYPDIGLPNTNNGLEGIFSDIKTKLRVHSGLTREHRVKLIDEYLSRHY